MAEPQVQKNKKVKKKPEANLVSDNFDRDAQNNVATNNDSTKQSAFKEVASTKSAGNTAEGATNCGKNETVDESSGKKKKKSKKKSKDVLKETFPENKNSESLLNFSENGIHLVNHPEISVTIADAACESSFVKVESKDNEVKSAVESDKVPSLDNEKQENAAPEPAPEASKKKKNKKKKKSNSISNEVIPTTTAANTSETTQHTIPTPTYTKVVTADNTCVLVVNNEKFSIDTKPVGNSESIKIKSDNRINFSLPSEKQLGSVLLTKNAPSDSNIQFGNSVSIFPVLTDSSVDVSNPKSINISCNSEESCNASNVDIKEDVKDNLDESKLTKSQLKAERRAKQEAQRAAKLAKNNPNAKTENTSSPKENNKSALPKEKPASKSFSKPVENITEKSSSKATVEKESLHKMKLFSHLPQYKPFDINAAIHPAILEIGFQYNKGIICGSNARCVALLGALKEVIKDFAPEPDKNFCRELESNIQFYLSFLNNCRPLSVSMLNAVKFLKHEINQMPPETDFEQIKEELYDSISNFVKINILIAREAIGKKASYKILDGDVILVYAFSSLVRDVLCKAHHKKKVFRVIVVDSRPKLEGLKMLRCLVKQGLQCSYVSINAVSYVMKEVSKVIIGAHALMSNGCVMSRIGNRQIALVASTYDVPVFVCCESYKYCDRTDIDSVVHNELGDPADIIATSLVSNDSLKNWRELPTLQPLNLLYDITSPDLLSGLITEKCVLPCTSVSVLLRVKCGNLSL